MHPLRHFREFFSGILKSGLYQNGNTFVFQISPRIWSCLLRTMAVERDRNAEHVDQSPHAKLKRRGLSFHFLSVQEQLAQLFVLPLSVAARMQSAPRS